MGKPWWTSKTLWTNAVALLASVAAAAGLDIGPDVQASIVGGVLAMVNIALRVVTKEPLKGGSNAPPA